MASQKRKGIATEQIFYIVIGIAVVSVLLLVFVNYSGRARSEGACRTAQDNFCEALAAANWGEADMQPGNEWTTLQTRYSVTAATCTKPPKQLCEARGYRAP